MSAYSLFYSVDSLLSSTVIALPTVANRIVTYTDTIGSLSQDPSTAINIGTIQAGLSGVPGSLISYPASAATGYLSITAANNIANYITTLTNASMSQSTTLTIPDPGPTGISSFILSGPIVQTITNINITNCTTNSLVCTTSSIGTLSVGPLVVTNLIGTSSTSSTLIGTNIQCTNNTIGTLNATTCTITSLSVTNANINTANIISFAGSLPTTANNATIGTITSLLSTNANVTSSTISSFMSTNANVTSSSIGSLTIGSVTFKGTYGSGSSILYTGTSSGITRIPFTSSSTFGIRPPTIVTASTGSAWIITYAGEYLIYYNQSDISGNNLANGLGWTVNINGSGVYSSNGTVSYITPLVANDVVAISASLSNSTSGNGAGYIVRIG